MVGGGILIFTYSFDSATDHETYSIICFDGQVTWPNSFGEHQQAPDSRYGPSREENTVILSPKTKLGNLDYNLYFGVETCKSV